MRKIVLIGILLVNILFASTNQEIDNEKYLPEFKKYVSYSKNISLENIISTDEIFFGTEKRYLSSETFTREGIASSSVNGALSGLASASAELSKGFLNEGLKAGVTGLGIGLIFGGINAINKSIKNSKMDKKLNGFIHVVFYLVEEIKNNKNDTTIKRTMIIFNKIKYKDFNNDKKTLSFVKNKIKG